MGQHARLREAGDPATGPPVAARMARALHTVPPQRESAQVRAPISNAAMARALATTEVQARLAVSHVDDPQEREAERFAARVVAGGAISRGAALGGFVRSAAATAEGTRGAARRANVAPARSAHPVATATRPVAREDRPGGPESAGGAGPGLESVGAGPEMSASLESFITGISGGEPLAEALRERIEPVLGADLSNVRVHTDDASAAAAAQIHARAFTYGKDIFVGPGESPADLALMAHESTHVVQQGAVEVYRLFDFVGDAAKEAVADLAQEIPGYDLLSQVAGQDLITGRAVQTSRAEFVGALLSNGPFAGAVGPILKSLDALDQIFDLISSRLAEHNLSLDRILGDMAAAWAEMDFTSLPSTNVAIAERYIARLLSDVTAFVAAIVNDVIEAVKAAAKKFAQPLVEKPPIQPYWDLGVKVFHYNPLTGESVDAPTVDILRDLLRLLGKEQVMQQMDERGTLAETAKWLDEQFATFRGLQSQAEQLIRDVIDAISPDNIGSLIDNLTSLADRAYNLLLEFKAFAETVIGKILELVKKALLGWLSEHAHKLPGFHLLTVMLERNPFTDEKVDRNATNLIKGFITLLPNGETVFDQLAESGTIASAAGKIEGAMGRLNITWDLITGTFRAIWDGLKLEDLVAPTTAFDRIVAQFGEPLGRIIEFATTVLQVVVELILKLMNFPSELIGNIVANAMAAIDDIKRDPIQFLQNVVLALKQGFIGFFDNIGTYLLQGLTNWLFRGIRELGIEPPQDVSLKSIITLVIQVAGVTEEALWAKLAKRIGQEKVDKIRRAIEMLGQAWAFIKDVQGRGIEAVWEFIQGQLSNLWDTILNTAKDWIVKEVVTKATTRLATMLDPTGVMAAVNSAVVLFDTIRTVMEYINEILAIVDRYVATIAAVAKGNIGPGAAMIESGLASAIPVALGFIANLLHLDDVPDKIREIIVGLRELIDQALEWLFDQAMALGQAALDALVGEGGQGAAVDPLVVNETLTGATAGHRLTVDDESSGDLMVHSDPITPLDEVHVQEQALRAAGQRLKTAYLAHRTILQALAGSPPSSEQATQLQQHAATVAAAKEEIKGIAARQALVAPLSGEALFAKALALLTDLHATIVEPVLRDTLAQMEAAGTTGLVDAVRVAYDAITNPVAIADVLVEIEQESAAPDGSPLEPIELEIVVPGTGPGPNGTIKLALGGSPEERFLAALLRMNQDRERRDTGNEKALVKVLLTRKKGKRIINFNTKEFFQEVATHGWPFLDVAIVNVPGASEHGATTHLIQDLVVDKAMQKIGWSAARLRQSITGSIWESLYDQMAGFEGTTEQMNDPNRVWPVLREIVGDLDRALAGVNSAWHAQQAAPPGSAP